MVVDIHTSWLNALQDYLDSTEFKNTAKQIRKEYLDKSTKVYPPPQFIFNALNKTPLDKVKIVILGQDPYHGEGQAHGLSFSVPEGVPTPPSLQNIFKELLVDAGIRRTSTDLTDWAEQGVLLLNSTLTVRAGEPTSHSSLGWESFTDEAIKSVSETQDSVVFILWGAYAKGKKILIDTGKHMVLEAVHPSPLSAHRGFFGCGHFSKANDYLKKHNKIPINW